MKNKEYDMSPILAVLNEAHEKLMDLAIKPKKKVSKREKALRELLESVESYTSCCDDKAYSRGVEDTIYGIATLIKIKLHEEV